MKLLFATVIAAVLSSSVVYAQRVIPTPGSQPRQSQQIQQAQPGPQVRSAPVRSVSQAPIPDSTVKQAKAHINGEYTYMERAAAGGYIQQAWDHMPERDSQLIYDYCATCTYKIRTREHMITLITLPDGETIAEVHNGDPDGFKASLRPKDGDKKIVAVQPHGFGMDTNLTIVGSTGRIYPFYVRAEGVNSSYVPDLVVRVKGNIKPDGGVLLGTPKAEKADPAPTSPAQAFPAFDIPADNADDDKTEDLKDKVAKADNGKDFVKSAPFDPSKLHGWGEYELWGEGWTERMMPETVFRDDHFTYIRFGDNWNNIELPTAYVVIDDIDELVNTRVNDTTYIVESNADLISLKIGEKYLCLKWTGDTSGSSRG